MVDNSAVVGSKAKGLKLIVGIAASLFAGVYFELFWEMRALYLNSGAQGLVTGYYGLTVIFRCALFCILAVAAFLLLRRLPCHVSILLFRYRYPIAIAIFAGLVLAELSQSSIAYWANQLPGGNANGLLFGIPRSIRSDEYNVSTMWFLSQGHTGYSAWSDILRGGLTDTRLVYNLPSFSLATVFRPFLWGFLFLGSAKGLSFLTLGRLFALFFASFECFRVISNDDKRSSLIFALVVTFSPIVLWWNIWEGLIYGQLLVVSLNALLRTSSAFRALGLTFALAWLCGCYVLNLYPAWMVPFFYVFAVLGVWVGINCAQAWRKVPKRILLVKIVALPFFLCVMAACVLMVFSLSSEVLTATSSTVYPGARFETGGGALLGMFNYGSSLFFPLEQFGNVCESSSMMSLFPLGTLLGILTLWKTRDSRILFLLLLQIALLVFVAIGVPPIIARITLLSNCPAGRVLFATGYVETLLLILSVSLLSRERDGETASLSLSAVALSVAVGVAALSIISSIAIPSYGRLLYRILLIGFFFILLTTLFLCLVGTSPQEWLSELLWVVVCCIVVPGACIMPIQQGIAPVVDTEFARDVSTLVSKDPDAKWIVEGSWMESNLCTALGASTIGSTNAYPNMEVWHVLDPDGKYEYLYNRYAHVTVKLVHGNTAFKLIAGDSIQVNMNDEDLNRLHIKYLVTSKKKTDDGVFKYKKIAKSNGLFIYKIEST